MFNLYSFKKVHVMINYTYVKNFHFIFKMRVA